MPPGREPGKSVRNRPARWGGRRPGMPPTDPSEPVWKRPSCAENGWRHKIERSGDAEAAAIHRPSEAFPGLAPRPGRQPMRPAGPNGWLLSVIRGRPPTAFHVAWTRRRRARLAAKQPKALPMAAPANALAARMMGYGGKSPPPGSNSGTIPWSPSARHETRIQVHKGVNRGPRADPSKDRPKLAVSSGSLIGAPPSEQALNVGRCAGRVKRGFCAVLHRWE